jgi:hypothetical protein
MVYLPNGSDVLVQKKLSRVALTKTYGTDAVATEPACVVPDRRTAVDGEGPLIAMVAPLRNPDPAIVIAPLICVAYVT